MTYALKNRFCLLTFIYFILSVLFRLVSNLMTWLRFLRRVKTLVTMSVPYYLSMQLLGWLLLFGPIGVFARYFFNVLVVNIIKIDNFWGTFVINLLGCVAIGLVRVFGVEKGQLSEALSIALMVGLIGGFTTFSGYSLDTFLLFDHRRPLKTVFACLNGILQPVFGILQIGRAHV